MLTQDNTIPNFMEDTFAHKALTWDNPRKISMTNKFVKEIEKLCSFSSSLKILEIGTGTGLVGLQLVSKASEMLLIDTSPSMLQILEKNYKTIHILTLGVYMLLSKRLMLQILIWLFLL